MYACVSARDSDACARVRMCVCMYACVCVCMWMRVCVYACLLHAPVNVHVCA